MRHVLVFTVNTTPGNTRAWAHCVPSSATLGEYDTVITAEGGGEPIDADVALWGPLSHTYPVTKSEAEQLLTSIPTPGGDDDDGE